MLHRDSPSPDMWGMTCQGVCLHCMWGTALSLDLQGRLTLGPAAAAAASLASQGPATVASKVAGAAGVGVGAVGAEGKAPQPWKTTCHPTSCSALPGTQHTQGFFTGSMHAGAMWGM